MAGVCCFLCVVRCVLSVVCWYCVLVGACCWLRVVVSCCLLLFCCLMRAVLLDGLWLGICCRCV